MLTGLTATDTTLTIADCLKCSKCLPSARFHRLALSHRAPSYLLPPSTQSHRLALSHTAPSYLLPTAPVRPALYFPALNVFHSSHNKRATEVIDGTVVTCGPSVVKHRGSRDFSTISFRCCRTHILSTAHIKLLCQNI